MSAYDVVVVAPNPAVDSYYVLPRLQVGDVNRSYEVLHTAGGKGNNMARAVHHLGGRALSLGIVGGTSGKFIANELLREGIDTDLVWCDAETRRCSSILDSDTHEATIVLQNGAAVGQLATQALLEKVNSYRHDTSFITLTGSVPPDVPPDFYSMCVQLLAKAPARIAIDTSGLPLRAAIEAGAHIVKINTEEFEDTFAPWSISQGIMVLSEFAPFGLELLIVTAGKQGAYLFSEGMRLHVATKVENWINTAGAGDTFLAGFLLQLNAQVQLQDAVCYASAAAAANLQQVGCGFVNPQDLDKFLRHTVSEVL